MVESIHSKSQWAGIPSPASVKKVKKRGANDGKKEFFKNFRRRYSGKEEKENDEQMLDEDVKKAKKITERSGDNKEAKIKLKKARKRGNNIDILI